MKKSINIAEKITEKFDKELLTILSTDVKAFKKLDTDFVTQLENIRAAKLVA